jgi:quercetin dioxygenase-like cupin family protein
VLQETGAACSRGAGAPSLTRPGRSARLPVVPHPGEADDEKRGLVALALAVGVITGWTAATVLHAQPTGIKRTLLMKKELAGIDGREVYLGSAEVAPGASAGRHYDDGQEVGFVLERTAVLEVEGQPLIELKPGDHCHTRRRLQASRRPKHWCRAGQGPGVLPDREGQAARGRRALRRPAGQERATA